MNTIRIHNHSAGAVIRSYAVTPENVIVWLELAPQHPKVTGALWASLVDRSGEWLLITDEDPDRHHEPARSFYARGLRRRYHRLTMDTPNLAGRARPKFLRLVAPDLCRLEDASQPFGVLAWPEMSTGTTLAAMLEQGTPYPIRASWGDYLLAVAVQRGHAQPLKTGGQAPNGYWIEPAPWDEIIAQGVREGYLSLKSENQKAAFSRNSPAIN